MCDRPPRTILIPRDDATGFLVTATFCTPSRRRRLLPDVTVRLVALPNAPLVPSQTVQAYPCQ
jgi:hypothetical protein